MKKRFFSVHYLLPGFLLAFTFCLFAPIELYFSNAEEFWFSLSDLIPWLLLSAFAVFLIISLLASTLPTKASVAFRAAVYAVSFMLYIQGNLLVLDYGKLNGSTIDWSAHTISIVLNSLLWILAIASFIVLMFRFRKKFRNILEIAACILLMTQLISIGVFWFQGRTGENNAERYLSNQNEFSLSNNNNTIVFLLDAFDAHLMDNIYDQDPELVKRLLPDFTFYRNTVGGSTRTRYAIPFIFSGDTNREEQSYQEYVKKGFAESPLIHEMASGDYDVGIYSISQYIDCNREDAIDNIASEHAVPSSGFGLTKKFMQLVSFKYAPSLMARFFWMYTGEFEAYKRADGSAPYALDDNIFHSDLRSSGLKANTEKGVFRFYHLQGAHEPYTLDEMGWRTEQGNSNEVIQAKGSLQIVSEYIALMKELELYDSATIIIMADHGFAVHSRIEQTPVLMVKLRGETHPFDISDLPLSYVSMPGILQAALRGELTSMEKWRSEGTRFYYHYSEKGTQINITEFAIDGPALETVPVETGVVFHGDSLHRSRNYTPGSIVYFDDRDTARNYIISGFSRNEGSFTWTEGTDAELLFQLSEAGGPLELVLEHGTFDAQQRVDVYINEKHVGSYLAKGETKQIIPVPVEVSSEKEIRLHLHLPDAISPIDLGIGTDERKLALSMKSVLFQKKK